MSPIIIAGALVLAAGAFLAVYDIRHTEGGKRKLIIAVNAVLAVIAAGTVIYSVAAHSSYKEDKEMYDVSGDDLTGAIRYVKTEDDYYVFSQAELMSPASYIAVPKADLSLPALTKLFPYVMIYSQWGSEKFDAKLSVGNCRVWSGVVKIVPEHYGFAVVTVLFAVGTAFLYDLINFIRIFIARKRASKNNNMI